MQPLPWSARDAVIAICVVAAAAVTTAFVP